MSDMLAALQKQIANGLIEKSLDTCSRWAEHRIYTPNPYPGPLSFDRFPWQREILDCTEPFVTVQKAAQMGFSVAGLIKAVFKVDAEKEDVLYVLPTAHLASDFAKARLDQIVAMSPYLKNIFTNSNNVGLKSTVDHAHIFIRGSISEAGLVSVPVSTAIVDEFDRCNIKAMSLVLERLSAHERKHFFGLSTPTLPNYGINKQFLQGTQENFVFQCPSCSKKIYLIWPDCIEIIGESASDARCHESYLKCNLCGAKLPHETKRDWLTTGKWEPTAKAHGHRSFHINQMYGTAITPGELVVAYHKGLSDDAAQVEFVNQKRGEPHLLEGARVTDAVIDSCLGNYTKDDPRPVDSSRNIVMGVDVGTFLDIVIAEYIYTSDPGYEPHLNSICKVLWEGRMAGSDFGSLDMLMAEWQVKYACVDFQPETNLAKAFARRFYGFASVCQYRKGTTGHEMKEAFDSDRVSILTLDRTSFLDLSLGRFHRKKLMLPKNISSVFREHSQNLVRTYEKDEMGRPKAVYVSLGADHLAHALTLTEAAHMKSYTKTTGRPIKPGESILHF